MLSSSLAVDKSGPHRSRLRFRAAFLVALATTLPVASAFARPSASTTAVSEATPHARLMHVAMHDVVLYPYDDVAAAITALDGQVRPERPPHPIVMDDVTSYWIDVDSASARLTADDMTHLMNHHVLPLAHTPIKEVTVHFGQNQISMAGTMVKLALPIPFTATATLAPTTNGDLRIHVVSMQAAGIIPKQLIDSLGLPLSTLAQPTNTNVFHIEGDDLIVPVLSMFPPPRIGGRVTAVHVSPAGLDIILGRPPSQPASAPSAITFRGGTLVFAKLTMRDTDLTVISDNAAQRLAFSPAHYYAQLEAGETRSLPSFGLLARVRNFQLIQPAAAPAP